MTQNNESEEYLSKICSYANTLGIGSVDSLRLLAFIESISQNEQPKQIPDERIELLESMLVKIYEQGITDKTYSEIKNIIPKLETI